MLHSGAIWFAALLLLGGCSSGGDEAPAGAGAPAAGTPPPSGGGGSASPPAAPAAASALFVLGDSLSDVGNVAGIADYLLGRSVLPPTVGLCNPADVFVVPRPCDDLFYRQNRVSDGPVTVEHLAAHLDLAELVPSFHVVPSRPARGTNYAVASAKARGAEVEDLARQVDVLLLDHAPLPADALYVVMIGGNDAIDAWQAALDGGPTAADASATIIASAVAAIGANVERLLDFGARWIVVANIPELAAVPAVLAEANASRDAAAVLAAASSVSAAFNAELGARLEQIASQPQWSSPTPPIFVWFDLHVALQTVQETTAASGGNALDACFDSDAYRQSATATRVFHAECAPPTGGTPRFSEFVFWDGIHPTGAAHAAIGAVLIDQVDAALAEAG